MVERTRRNFLKSLAPAVLSGASVNTVDAEELGCACEYHADRLAQAMAQRYGGQWRSVMRHDLGTVYIIRQPCDLG